MNLVNFINSQLPQQNRCTSCCTVELSVLSQYSAWLGRCRRRYAFCSTWVAKCSNRLDCITRTDESELASSSRLELQAK